MAENKTPWYESNLLWGPLSLGCAIILSVVATIKHDLRGLLWIAWPLFAISIWMVAKRTKEVLIITILGTAIFGVGLFALNSWLRSQVPQQVKNGDSRSAKQSVAPEAFE